MIIKNQRIILFSLVITICLQLTDVKIINIKVSELLMLLLVPITFREGVSKFIIYFLVLFSTYLIISIVLNLNRSFFFDLGELALLKRPYLISISRFLELLSCITFALFVYKGLKYFVVEKDISLPEMLEYVLRVNFFLSIFFLMVYFFYKANHWLLGPDSFIVHNVEAYNPLNFRMRGFYFEGGPFGLMYATLFALATFVPNKNLWFKAIFLVMVVLAKSKAGYLMVIFWILYNAFLNYRMSRILKLLAFSMLLPIFFISLYIVASNYISVFNDIERQVIEKQDDFGLVMGRISGAFIVPEMIKDNWLVGIGLGNYPLVRNNPNYLGIFPSVPYWDEHGLGGLVSLLVEGGLLFFTLFLAIIFRVHKGVESINKHANKILLLFILPCLLGVQLHFMYIWFIMGLAIFISHYKVDYKFRGHAI